MKELTSYVVKGVSEMENVLLAGKKNRSVGATLMNQVCGREREMGRETEMGREREMGRETEMKKKPSLGATLMNQVWGG